MKPIHWTMIILGVIALGIGGYLAWDALLGEPALDTLMSEALTSSDQPTRLLAVSHMTMASDRNGAVSRLQRLVKESEDPQVQQAALTALIGIGGYENIPFFISSLDNPNPRVREKAFAHVKTSLGNRFPEKLKYKVKDSAENHALAISKLEEIYNDKSEPDMKKPPAKMPEPPKTGKEIPKTGKK